MIHTYIDWLTRTALPFWAERGFDNASARFHERLDLAGMPIDVPHRAMVQARQIYVYAHATILGWYPEGAVLAERAMASLIRDFGDESAGQQSFAFAIDRGGRVTSDVRDSYTHAFVLFAIGSLYRLNHDPALLAMADRTLAFLDEAMVDRVSGGLYDAVPIIDRSKRQNPLMHLLEACLCLEEAAPGRGYIDRASAIIDLFHARLYRTGPGVLLEHFAEDWSRHGNPGKADRWEPGHHMEWAWLLAEYNRLSGKHVEDVAASLYSIACDHGFAESGLMYDELDLDLRPVKTSHRLWPHSEAIKAAIKRNDPALADRMAAALLDHCIGRPFAAGWIDQFDATGAASIDYVPASSLYHLFLAGAEAASASFPFARSG